MMPYRIKTLGELTLIEPVWSAPDTIEAFVTTRIGGVSEAPFQALNLATHVGDESANVFQNRALLAQQTDMHPIWLDQRHTVDSVELTKHNRKDMFIADASWTQTPALGCCVMTADCLPILLTNYQGSLVAAIHAGWKGLLDGVVSQTILALPEVADQLIAWVGPAISQPHFEVGEEVVEAFIQKNPAFTAFICANGDKLGKFLLDLPGLVKFELLALGLSEVTLSGLCSYQLSDWFYSYRREGQTGRMASMIEIKTF